MSSRRKEPPTEELDVLRRRVTGWRAGRTERGPMPADIWDSAVALARMYGPCKISRAVDLDYKSLRLRVARSLEKPGLVGPTFVQLPATLSAENVTVPVSGATIEISAPDGSRMAIHLEAGRGVEAAGIVAAFLRSRA
jgi:hypothetical protein